VKKHKKVKELNAQHCAACKASCCRYVTVAIDEPTCKRDYDHIRWSLMHKSVFVYIDHEDDWFVEFETPCESLAEDHSCGAYGDRPKICRDHGDEDDGVCVFLADDDPHTHRFGTAREFEDYLSGRGKDWKWKKL
jgi:hypothetical protein